MREVWAQVSSIAENSEVVSFDLYDTIIMRQSLTSRSVYESVWSTLHKAGYAVPDRAAFVEARLRADAASKVIDAPTLRQILQHLDDGLQTLSDQIEATEIDVELSQLRVVPGAAEYVAQVRKSGHRIAFISDMHMGSVHLGPKLVEMGLMQSGDLLMVSSDHGYSKSRHGRLFKHFLSSHNLAADSVTHFGNDQWSDVKMALKHGIAAKHCPSGNLNRFESLLVDESAAHAQMENIASVCRDTRLRFGTASELSDQSMCKEEDALAKVASSVASPVLVAFVLWAIKRCREESITTVRFLTRDGELPFQIAKALPESITTGLDLDMLEVSRRSLLLPAASVVPLEKWLKVGMEPGSFLVQHYDRLPASQVIARVGLSFYSHADVLNRFGIVESDEPLGKDGLKNWRRALNDEAIRQLILRESGERLGNVSKYLQQNLPDMSINRCALIDIGWTGQQAAMLSALIRQQGGCDPLHLHVGRLRTRPLIVEAAIDGWLFDERVQRSPVENPVALFESFCVTTTGGVDRYRVETDGTAKAVRRTQNHKSNVLSWGQPVLRQSVLRFAQQAGGMMNTLCSDALRDVCETLLKEFWESPTWYEAKKWGAFPYEQDQTGQTVRHLANPYNLAQLRARLNDTYSGIDWKAGSVALSPSPVRQILRIRERYRRQ